MFYSNNHNLLKEENLTTEVFKVIYKYVKMNWNGNLFFIFESNHKILPVCNKVKSCETSSKK